jgi:hypothetical protein
VKGLTCKFNSLKSELVKCQAEQESARAKEIRLISEITEEKRAMQDEKARQENRVKTLVSANRSYEHQVRLGIERRTLAAA